ncbi:TetR family transcriptional regulator [Shinella curvata]|uniref:TetR family transcriptional regulator n=1 Tax=Shinella curvata TaxID=1817964 RepID=A0ABT8XLM1_9HYPH|nr:TetR family transcriptional regulator [Shinella curvata]MCJ8057025.1 TetR family transcriptional regulator [Shinella curvata]MDO6124629.1 TetR family transcriptional regulator [Shinella curvata]
MGRAAAVGLTRERVVDAAIALIDEEGLPGFSVRALARRLNVFPAALYWHAGGRKTDLFAEISGALIAGLMAHDDRAGDWRDTIRTLFKRFRSRIHQHPNAAPLLGPSIRSNGAPNAPWVEIVLAALVQAGFKEEGLIDAFNAVVGALEGFVTIELAADEASEDSEWVKTFDADLEALDADVFPLTKQYLPRMYNQSFVMRWKSGNSAPLDKGYDFLIETLISGLEMQAQRSSRP